MTGDQLEFLTKHAESVAAQRYECGNCAWFAAAKGDDEGTCHRYPPAHFPQAANNHPATTRHNVCGEFVHKKDGSGFRDHITAWMKAIGEHIGWLERKLAEP